MAAGKTTAAALGAWLVFEDETGFSMTPPTARTWSPRGHTPTVIVRGRSRRRVSIAALTCHKPGRRSRLIYRPRRHDRSSDRKSLSENDYRDLLDTAHQQLGGPMVLTWDNLNTHTSARMRRFIAARDWLTVYQLPAYAPELNPVEGIWSLLRRRLANTLFTDPAHLTTAIRSGLRRIQHQPAAINGCLTETGLRP
ncbi:IS630 family transposase [Nocardia terpenica]|uniref:DDE endonuclease n=1 Tax=Nocardia terpenica TaxID=455432 RepID=A0A291RJ94_9NOCA|nr:transposase [Nocardia terpenica]ATL64876.1 DDE endonuclease [Nocardia terpenica]ATL67360.1 DDE endonuclease [Nocardia terpenica]ATL69202.1 DDE endonuclease [Nocardia terpenica]